MEGSQTFVPSFQSSSESTLEMCFEPMILKQLFRSAAAFGHPLYHLFLINCMKWSLSSSPLRVVSIPSKELAGGNGMPALNDPADP